MEESKEQILIRLNELVYRGTIEERCEAAKDPNLSLHLQRALAQDSSREVRALLTQNPQVQADLLFSLAKDFPGDYLENPLFSLMLLENAYFLTDDLKHYQGRYSRGPRGYDEVQPSLLALFSHPKMPVHLLWAIVESTNVFLDEIVEAIAQNPGAPPEILERLAFHGHHSVRKIARENAALPRDFVEALQQLETTKAPLSKEMLLRIAQSDIAAAQSLIGYPHLIFEESFIALARMLVRPRYSFSFDLMLSLMQRPEIPAGALHEFVMLEEQSVHQAAARHPSIAPASLLEAFRKHTYRDFLFIVLRNPKAPNEVLQNFAKVKSLDLRCLAARNPGASEELLLFFATQKNVDLRRAVAQNPSCTKAVLELLSKDSDRQVRTFVAKRYP